MTTTSRKPASDDTQRAIERALTATFTLAMSTAWILAATTILTASAYIANTRISPAPMQGTFEAIGLAVVAVTGIAAVGRLCAVALYRSRHDQAVSL